MPDVPANRVLCYEADDLVASCVVDRMAAAGAFYLHSAVGHLCHPLFERMAFGMATNEESFISCFIVMLYFRDRFVPHHFADRFGRYHCGLGTGDGRDLSRGIVELAKDRTRLVNATNALSRHWQ